MSDLPDGRPTPPAPSPARREGGHPSGWDRYLSLLERHHIPQNQRGWYMKRAEAFIEAMRPTRMTEVTEEQIRSFLPRYAREQQLTDWQLRQTVDAVQLLLVDLAHNPGAQQVDWDDWKSAAKPLAPDHPTLTRTMTPEDAVTSRSYFQRSAEDLDVLKELARTLRARRYAIRTEQTYVDWCHRFMQFCGRPDPASWEPADVERFLAHLAADRGVAASTQNQALNAKDRVVPLPERLRAPLEAHLRSVHTLHQEELAAGAGEVYLPDALARKAPNAPREWIWQYVLPSARLATDPKGCKVRRHHLDESGVIGRAQPPNTQRSTAGSTKAEASAMRPIASATVAGPSRKWMN